MEITKVVKPFIRRGANTFGNIVCISFCEDTCIPTMQPVNHGVD